MENLKKVTLNHNLSMAVRMARGSRQMKKLKECQNSFTWKRPKIRISM